MAGWWSRTFGGTKGQPLCMTCKARPISFEPAAERFRMCTQCHAEFMAKRLSDEAAWNATLKGAEWWSVQPGDARFDPAEVVDRSAIWPVQGFLTEFGETAEDVLATLAEREQGGVYLGRDDAHNLIVEWSGDLGVVSIVNGFENPDFVHLFAATPDNVTSQVAAADHAMQACACCGAGMTWHPSRAHMPKSRALEVFRAAYTHDYARSDWGQMPDTMRMSQDVG